jgi:ribosomal 30S subunit maturation factor RimM
MAGRLAVVGVVRSVSPGRRMLRVALRPGAADHLKTIAWVTVILRDGTEMRCKVETARGAAVQWRLTLAAGVTRDSIARMRGAAVMAEPGPRTRKADAGRDVADWIGFDVFDAAGERVGAVTDVYLTGASDVIEVTRTGGNTFRAPAIDPVIASVDLDRGTIVLKDIVPYAVEDED